MLSIIVSTVYPERLERFRRNVAETIGDIPYEIIAIENVKNPRSLANVYNEGGSRARFPYLLFMHEDAGFITKTGLRTSAVNLTSRIAALSDLPDQN